MKTNTLTTSGRGLVLTALALLFIGLSYIGYEWSSQAFWSPSVLQANSQMDNGQSFDYEVIENDLAVGWPPGGDFDPKDKCPEDFFSAGFVLVCKKLADGAYFNFLYHSGKGLLYRIDRDIINNQVRFGLHWVESTRYNAKYRIADPQFKGTKTVEVPTAKGGTESRSFNYGQAVSKKRSQPGRELFKATHIKTGECKEWGNIHNFKP